LIQHYEYHSQGRPLLLSLWDIRALARIIKAYSFSSAKDITHWVNALRASAGSTRTVRRAMHKPGFKSATPVTKPWVSDANKVQRVAWAK